MSKIQLTARFAIHEGKVDEFMKLAAACRKVVQEKDKGCLQYDWFVNMDGSECVVRETYIDSEAVLAHLGHLGELFPALLAISNLSLEVYGCPSEALIKTTEDIPTALYLAV